MMIVNLISDKDPATGQYASDDLYLSNYATIQIQDELRGCRGVGDVTFLGQRDYSMRVWLDPEKLATAEPRRPPTWSRPSRSRTSRWPPGRSASSRCRPARPSS